MQFRVKGSFLDEEGFVTDPETRTLTLEQLNELVEKLDQLCARLDGCDWNYVDPATVRVGEQFNIIVSEAYCCVMDICTHDVVRIE